MLPPQDHLPTADVRDITALKHVFPASFDPTGNMPGDYMIHSDPPCPQFSMPTGRFQ